MILFLLYNIYYQKYLKYKMKYLELKHGGGNSTIENNILKIDLKNCDINYSGTEINNVLDPNTVEYDIGGRIDLDDKTLETLKKIYEESDDSTLFE